MSDKLKIHWVTQVDSTVANALGYQQFNAAMKKYCAQYFDYDDSADVAIQLIPADFFHPVPGKKNILFSMWECIDIPESYKKGLGSADLVIVPSEWNRQVFQPFAKNRVKTCFLGVEPEVFYFKERNIPNPRAGEHFRILWLGAPNPRKGYYSVLELIKIVEKVPELELYIKTTAANKLSFKELLITIKRRLAKVARNPRNCIELVNIVKSIKRFVKPEIAGTVQYHGPHKNIVVDMRKLALGDIVDLYHSAHCFVMPHMGEGWCLPLAEAMATGCPCVASNSTAVLDYFNKEVGFPVKVDIKTTDLLNYNIQECHVYVPDTLDLVNQLFFVIKNYREALKRGRKASYKIRTDFTWKKAAKRLNDIVVEFVGPKEKEQSECLSAATT